MNIEYANSIPMRVILAKLGYQPRQTIGKNQLYKSPLCAEQKIGLVVSTDNNTWNDPAAKSGGNALAFVCAYLRFTNENDTIADALRWLKNMVGYPVLQTPTGIPDYSTEDKALELRHSNYLANNVLIRYLEEDRCIPFEYARFILKEVTVYNTNTQKQFIALGVENEEGGFAIRNAYIKANIKQTATTFIRGQISKPNGIHIFKDVYDYLSLIAHRSGEPLLSDAIILNSMHCMKESGAYIKNYGYRKAYTWLDNTEDGDRASRNYKAFINAEPDLKHIPMNAVYRDHKDVNAWLVSLSR